jgi:hypothetical protein
MNNRYPVDPYVVKLRVSVCQDVAKPNDVPRMRNGQQSCLPCGDVLAQGWLRLLGQISLVDKWIWLGG